MIVRYWFHDLLDWADRNRQQLTLVAIVLTLVALLAWLVGSVTPEARGDVESAFAAPPHPTAAAGTVAVVGGAVAVPDSQPALVESGTAYSPPVRLPSIQVTPTSPPTTVPPIVWGLAGTTDTTRCTQAEPLLEAHAPPGGWDVLRMSRLMRRESGCCPGVRGGDRTTDTCGHIRTVTYSHRSDVGLLQINGINYDPNRCGSSCVVDSDLWSLMDPVTNIEAAATLCSWWRAAGSSCYRPWS